MTRNPVKACDQAMVGYSVVTLGLVALLTINGASGFPGAIGIGTAVLVAIGLMLAAAGMLQLRRAVNQDGRAAAYGFLLQALGLIGLLVGVLPLAVSSSLSGLYLSAIVITTSAASAFRGGFLLRGHYADIGASNKQGVDYLIVGTTLIFAGVGLILASNIAKFFFLSEVGNNVITDVGAAVSACGCIIAAYAFSVLERARASSALLMPEEGHRGGLLHPRRHATLV